MTWGVHVGSGSAMQPEPSIQIGSRTLRAGLPTYIVAELGVNHNGELDLAKRLIDASAQAGVDAVKFQTFSAAAVVGTGTATASYQERNTAQGDQAELLRDLELSETDHRTLLAHARDEGVEFLSTPFDRDAVDLLDDLRLPLFKVASGEIDNVPLLRHIADKGKPVFLSTGMSALADVERAVGTLRQGGAESIAILHCTTQYPAPPSSVNLLALDTLRTAFRLPVGLSDHTEGSHIPIAAVARGACIIEKHVTLDRTLPGPDHRASLEPDALADMVRAIRDTESALGDGIKRPDEVERENIPVVRRSLAAAADLEAGHRLTADDIVALRPAAGIPPSCYDDVLGRQTRAPVRKGEPLHWENLS